MQEIITSTTYGVTNAIARETSLEWWAVVLIVVGVISVITISFFSLLFLIEKQTITHQKLIPIRELH